mgnify:CR=1 FL=1
MKGAAHAAALVARDRASRDQVVAAVRSQRHWFHYKMAFITKINRDLDGHLLSIWDGTSGLPPMVEQFYRDLWIKEAEGSDPNSGNVPIKAITTKCRWLGEATGAEVVCEPCGGRARLKIFNCRNTNTKGLTTISHASEEVSNCEFCRFKQSSAGVVIGTYGYPKLAAFQVRMIRDTCGDVPILIADDGSERDAEFEAIVESNIDVEFWPSDHRRGHYSGDLSVFWKGFQWAHNLGLKHLVKLSQRFVITEPRWLAKVCKLLEESGEATIMQDCIDNGGGNVPDCRLYVRSECMGFDVTKWVPYFKEFNQGELVNPTELYIWHRVHAYFGEQFCQWPRMPRNRYEPMPDTLWHGTNGEQDYRQVAATKGMTIDDDFTCAGACAIPGWKRG